MNTRNASAAGCGKIDPERQQMTEAIQQHIYAQKERKSEISGKAVGEREMCRS